MRLPSDWQELPLDYCLDKVIDYRGKTPPKADTGVPLITARNIRDGFLDFSIQEFIDPEQYSEWMSRGLPVSGDLLFTTEAPLGMAAMFPNEQKYAIAQRLVVLRTIRDVLESKYLMYFLLSPLGRERLDIRATGSTAKGIKQSELRKLTVIVPPLPEQRKIAEILSTWDEAIDLTEQLIAAKQRRKQALMQRLLITSREESSPNHRFPAFTVPWQQRQFGEVFERVTRKNTIGNDNVLTISAQRGLISQTHFFNKIVASDSLSGYYLLKHGEFAYNKSYSEGYPYGAFKRLNDYDAGVLSTLYVCFRIKVPNVNPDYFVHFFEAGGMNHGVYSIAQEGARNHGLLNMSVIDLFNLPLLIPSLEEQNVLAAFFNDIDHEIDLLRQKLTALRQQKQGLMQQLLTGKIRVKV